MVNTLKNFFAELGGRLPDTLAVMVAYWLPVFGFVWYSDLVDDIYARLWMSALVTVMPVATLCSKPKYGLRIWRWSGEDLGIALFLWLTTSLGGGEQIRHRWIGAPTFTDNRHTSVVLVYLAAAPP